MNLVPSIDVAYTRAIKADPYSLSAERAVIVGCLTDPERIADVAAKVVPADFVGEFHRRVVEILIGLSGEGRKPSIEAIVAVTGDEEIAPNLTVRAYLKAMVADSLAILHLPFDDALETIRDAAQRKALADVGNDLMFGATSGSRSIGDLATEAVARIDDVIMSLKAGKRRHYDAAGAAQSALSLLSTEAPANPTTGLIDLDHKLGGWPRGELAVVAGRPGTGKSAVATSTVLRAASAGFPACFFSLEMQDTQLGARLMTDIAYSQSDPIFYEDVLRRRVTEEHHFRRLMAAEERLRGLPLHIEEQRGLTMADISARARKVAAKFERDGSPLQVVLVDHLHIIKASGRYSGNRVRELAEISDGLATLAKELNVAVIALCQLSRAVEGRENKRPTMPDLRESGAIEEDASVIIFLYRAAYYLEKQRFDDEAAEAARRQALAECRHKLEFGIEKNRNGSVGIVDAFVDIGANAIRNVTGARI